MNTDVPVASAAAGAGRDSRRPARLITGGGAGAVRLALLVRPGWSGPG